MRYILGTASFGLAYGTAIRRELPQEDTVQDLLQQSAEVGFAGVDTARAYGSSEERIGRHLAGGSGFAPSQVSTKLSPLTQISHATSASEAAAAARESLTQSRQALGVDRLERVLLHRAGHIDLCGGAIWEVLKREQDAGRIGTLGVSVQSPVELERCLGENRVQTVQLACNILDHRFDNEQMEEKLVAASKDIEVRSVFLQGVLTAGDDRVFPVIGAPYDSTELCSWLRGAADRLSAGALDALCATYVASLPWVSAMVFGVDDETQLKRLAKLRQMPLLPQATRFGLRASRPVVPQDLLDPAKWAARTER